MKADFWHRKWAEGDIGFHEDRVNAFLLKHFDELRLPPGSRLFLPLCGKTRDIAWLLERGYRVAGVELSEVAIEALFEDLGLAPAIERSGNLLRYSGPGIDIHVGDIFELTAAQLGVVQAIYDRAALVALPAALRERYARHLLALCNRAPQLLITYEYDQSRMDGPPFSVSEDEVRRLYGDVHKVQVLEQAEVAGGMKGKVPATETAWLLTDHGRKT